MTDKLISDLTAIGAAIADNTAFEAQRNGQTTTEQALGSDLKTYIGYVKSNRTAVVDPTATDDTASGYAVGSPWFNSATGDLWVASDVTATAAVWQIQSSINWRKNKEFGLAYASAWQAITATTIGPAISTIGSAGGGNVYANTNERTRRKRIPQTTGTSAGSSAGFFSNNRLVLRGGASGRGGFRMLQRFAVNTIPTTWRSFVGLSGTIAAFGNADPSSLFNLVGVGKDTADTAWQIMSNLGSGTATKVALNSTDFPINDTTAVFEIELYCPPGNAQNVTYWFRKISGQDANGNDTYSKVVTGTISATLPVVDTNLTVHMWVNNDVQTTAAIIDMMRMYYEGYGVS